MNMSNAVIDANLLLELQKMGFGVEIREDDSEVYLSTCGLSLQNDGLVKAIEIIANFKADEVSVEEGRLRLWWD